MHPYPTTPHRHHRDTLHAHRFSDDYLFIRLDYFYYQVASYIGIYRYICIDRSKYLHYSIFINVFVLAYAYTPTSTTRLHPHRSTHVKHHHIRTSTHTLLHYIQIQLLREQGSGPRRLQLGVKSVTPMHDKLASIIFTLWRVFRLARVGHHQIEPISLGPRRPPTRGAFRIRFEP